MNVTIHLPAPAVDTLDVYGSSITIPSSHGGKIYLAFERNAGCPVCNLRTHELLKHADYFRSRKVSVYLVYESTADRLKEYLGDDAYPFQFIADPQNKLYHLYGVERSMLKMMRGMFHGLLAKASQGAKLFRKPMKQDGHMDRIPAEFIIGPNGTVELAHYGRYVGDHVPVETLKGYL